MSEEIKVSEQQKIYGTVLHYATLVGAVLLAVAFLLYIFGVFPGAIALPDLAAVWSLDVHTYLEKTGQPVGWGWLAQIHHGDMMSLASLGFLAIASGICYLIVLPVIIRQKDVAYIFIAVVQIAVILLAASGILHVGH